MVPRDLRDYNKARRSHCPLYTFSAPSVKKSGDAKVQISAVKETRRELKKTVGGVGEEQEEGTIIHLRLDC